MRPFAHSGQKQLPHAAAEQLSHRINPAVPAVEIANNADALRIGRPNGEVNTGRIAERAQVSAKFFVDLPMLALNK